jgi:hypothetical protein
LLNLLKWLGFLVENDQGYILTDEGVFWVHLAQNYFSLRYINKIWSAAMHTAFPERISF